MDPGVTLRHGLRAAGPWACPGPPQPVTSGRACPKSITGGDWGRRSCGGTGNRRLPTLCDIPSGCCTGPWTATQSSLRVLRRAAAFCRPLRPVFRLVSFPRQQSPAVGTPGVLPVRGSLYSFWCPFPSAPPPPGRCRCGSPKPA